MRKKEKDGFSARKDEKAHTTSTFTFRHAFAVKFVADLVVVLAAACPRAVSAPRAVNALCRQRDRNTRFTSLPPASPPTSHVSSQLVHLYKVSVETVSLIENRFV